MPNVIMILGSFGYSGLAEADGRRSKSLLLFLLYHHLYKHFSSKDVIVSGGLEWPDLRY